MYQLVIIVVSNVKTFKLSWGVPKRFYREIFKRNTIF